MNKEQENKFLSLVKEKRISAFNDWSSKVKEYNKTRSMQLLKQCEKLKGECDAYYDVICLFESMQEVEDEKNQS